MKFLFIIIFFQALCKENFEMNALRRALRVFCSSATSTERSVLHPATSILQSYSTAATQRRSKPFDESSPPSTKDVAVSERPTPTVIPFQPKVANSVNFIGLVHKPVQFYTSRDGSTWAATVITGLHSSDSSHPW